MLITWEALLLEQLATGLAWLDEALATTTNNEEGEHAGNNGR